MESNPARRALRKKKGRQHSQRGQHAVRGNKDCTDVEEDWMHLRQDISLRGGHFRQFKR